MRKSWKVAKWEVKRNVKNKSFIISLFLTPLLFILFATLPFLIDQFQEDSSNEAYQLYVTDQLGVWQDETDIPLPAEEWNVTLNPDGEEALLDSLAEKEKTVYMRIDEQAVEQGSIPVYLSPDVEEDRLWELGGIRSVLKQWQLAAIGFTTEEINFALTDIQFVTETVRERAPEEVEQAEAVDPLERIIPAAFAGIILFSVVITGMMTFQSASQEKKDKVAEIILSSVTPNELMQGKIIGYFLLGMIQVSVWIGMAIPIVQWRFDLPILQYIFVPELPVLLFFAIGGYLLFAALFVGLGATVEDMTTARKLPGHYFRHSMVTVYANGAHPCRSGWTGCPVCFLFSINDTGCHADPLVHAGRMALAADRNRCRRTHRKHLDLHEVGR